MSGCNIVTISKVDTVGDKGETVEFSKVHNALMSNAKTDLYLRYLDEHQADKVDLAMNILTQFSTDVVEVCYEKVKDISIEIDYDEPMHELSIALKLLLSHGHELMDEQYFNVVVELSDKYEELSINANLFSLSIDFNTELKGEYTRLITKIKRG